MRSDFLVAECVIVDLLRNTFQFKAGKSQKQTNKQKEIIKNVIFSLILVYPHQECPIIAQELD